MTNTIPAQVRQWVENLHAALGLRKVLGFPRKVVTGVIVLKAEGDLFLNALHHRPCRIGNANAHFRNRANQISPVGFRKLAGGICKVLGIFPQERWLGSFVLLGEEHSRALCHNQVFIVSQCIFGMPIDHYHWNIRGYGLQSLERPVNKRATFVSAYLHVVYTGQCRERAVSPLHGATPLLRGLRQRSDKSIAVAVPQHDGRQGAIATGARW